MNRRSNEGGEEWACYADMYLLSSVFFLMLYFITQSSLSKSKSELLAFKEEFSVLEKKVNVLQSSIQKKRILLHQVEKKLSQEKTYSKQMLQQNSDQKSTIETTKKELQNHKKQLKRISKKAEFKAKILRRTKKELEQLTKISKKVQNDLQVQKELRKQDAIVQKELRNQEAVVRKELLEVKGELNRVVFIFDRSGSMENRWDSTARILEKWFDHLVVKECVLLTFSTFVNVYPENLNYQFVPLGGKTGKNNKLRMIEWLREIKPDKGKTNTYKAFTEAYSYDGVDTIFLLTDGNPNIGKGQQEIVNLCSQFYREKGITVNTIALGDFLREKKFGEFLLEIARVTNGSFRGR